jgi:hypothetical protein
MIRYALRCNNGDEFEAWFADSAAYDSQAAQGDLLCPLCGSTGVQKALMAPAVRRSDRGGTPNPRAVAMAMAAKVKEHIRDNFDYVGERFASEARKIHDGDIPDRPIWGEATTEDARAMAEEGLPVSPLPPELAPTPPKKIN